MRLTGFRFALGVCCVFAAGACWGQESNVAKAKLPDGMVVKTPVIPEHIVGTLRAVNEAISRNVVPADNAAVFLVQVYGDDIFEDGLGPDSLQMLGIESISKTAPRLQMAGAYLKARKEIAPEKLEYETIRLQAQIVDAAGQVWKPDEFADVAEYLKTNDAALDAVVELTKKPRYFAPMLSAEDPPRLLSASLVIERRLPFLARTLSARAMSRLRSKDTSGAMSDILACHRLASLLGHGSPFDVSVATAGVADGVAFRAACALLQSGQLTGEQAVACQQALATIPPLVVAAQAANQGERAILHQELEFVQATPADIREFFENPCEEKRKAQEKDPLPAIKWDVALKRADAMQDRIVKALSTRERRAQNELFDALDKDIQKWRDTEPATSEKFKTAAELDIAAASEWIGESMAMALVPFYRQRRASEDSSSFRRDFLMTGLALIAYQREHGHYPADLAALVPKHLAVIPKEDDVPEMFIYVRDAENQIHLTHKGVNRMDDAGKNFNDDQQIELR